MRNADWELSWAYSMSMIGFGKSVTRAVRVGHLMKSTNSKQNGFEAFMEEEAAYLYWR